MERVIKLRKLLLKIAHKILKKYGVIPLCFQDKVLFMGKIYEIQSCDISKDFYKTNATIKMSDCFKVFNTETLED